MPRLVDLRMAARFRPTRSGVSFVLLGVLTTAFGCSGTPPPRGPRDTLDAYAKALEQGRPADAYALLSDEAKKNIPFESFERMVNENRDEIKDIADALTRPAAPPRVTSTVRTSDGRTLLLVYEDGAWRVDGSAIDLYSQQTPMAAVMAFVRAYENQRYDVLMRFVPDNKSGGLDPNKLKKAFEGEQREEMEQLTQNLKAELPTARIELLGDRATFAYGDGGTLELVREGGRWKIEEFRR